MSRTPPWHPDRPYNALPALPPAIDLETKPVLKRCVTARVALADLNRAADQIPNPRMLEISLPLLEAQASSEIENIVTSADTMFRHLRAHRTADPATREALRYRTALLGGFADLRTRPLGTETAERVCSRIKGTPMPVRTDPGTVIAGPAGIVYTPPVGETRIRELLANWEDFLHGADDVDPLVRMAAAHYQFEATHPFTDGNGRTGRALNTLFLVEQGLLSRPILYLSRHIIAHRPEYYRLLLDVTRAGAWAPWLLYMLQGVEETTTWTTKPCSACGTKPHASCGIALRSSTPPPRWSTCCSSSPTAGSRIWSTRESRNARRPHVTCTPWPESVSCATGAWDARSSSSTRSCSAS